MRKPLVHLAINPAVASAADLDRDAAFRAVTSPEASRGWRQERGSDGWFKQNPAYCLGGTAAGGVAGTGVAGLAAR